MPPLTLHSVIGNSQKLDGGAMFGNAPRPLWERWVQVDDRNRIDLACRTLLVREGERLVLLETGIGAFFEPKMRDRFGVVESEHVLLENLAALGVQDSDIDLVVLSHLHFDHAGGLLSSWQEHAEPTLLFPNATFVTGRDHWQRANAPHARDRASFIPVLNDMLEASGRLVLVDGPNHDALGPRYRFHFSDGHTPGLMLTEIDTPCGPVVFAADLIPGRPWVHSPITMGYDRFPERLIDEKVKLLTDLHARSGWLFFTHDPHCAMARVDIDERGRFCPSDAQVHVNGLPA